MRQSLHEQGVLPYERWIGHLLVVYQLDFYFSIVFFSIFKIFSNFDKCKKKQKNSIRSDHINTAGQMQTRTAIVNEVSNGRDDNRVEDSREERVGQFFDRHLILSGVQLRSSRSDFTIGSRSPM